MTPNRRAFLAGAAAFGVSVDFLAHAAYAATDAGLANRKFVAIVLRGGMDGLSAAPPVGDSAYEGLRTTVGIPGDQALNLDETFSLHPSLPTIHRLALAGQARIAPAVGTTDRSRSHFEAQDVLENGADAVYGQSSGWLNRALSALGPARKVSALSVGATAPLIMRGPAPAGSWSPGKTLSSKDRLPMLVSDLYAGDPVLSRAFAQGLATEDMAAAAAAAAKTVASASGLGLGAAATTAQGQTAARTLGVTVAQFMKQADGPQVVAISIDGYDTHANQGALTGTLATRLAYFDAVMDGLSSGLGAQWDNTVVVAATEFGRTARVNGTAGTDHGTASTAFVMGGGIKGGGLIGDWPTLAPAALFENRDTRPTLDMRGLFKGLLAEQLGVDKRALDTEVFPDSADIAPMRGLVKV